MQQNKRNLHTTISSQTWENKDGTHPIWQLKEDHWAIFSHPPSRPWQISFHSIWELLRPGSSLMSPEYLFLIPTRCSWPTKPHLVRLRAFVMLILGFCCTILTVSLAMPTLIALSFPVCMSLRTNIHVQCIFCNLVMVILLYSSKCHFNESYIHGIMHKYYHLFK